MRWIHHIIPRKIIKTRFWRLYRNRKALRIRVEMKNHVMLDKCSEKLIKEFQEIILQIQREEVGIPWREGLLTVDEALARERELDVEMGNILLFLLINLNEKEVDNGNSTWVTREYAACA